MFDMMIVALIDLSGLVKAPAVSASYIHHKVSMNSIREEASHQGLNIPPVQSFHYYAL